MPSIKLFDREKTDPERRDPRNRREKLYNIVYQRTYTSGFVILIAIFSFMFGIVPLPFVSVIPTWMAEGLLIFIVASLFAFLPARWVHNKFKSYPIDYIFEVDATNSEELVKVYQYYQGQFIKDFDVVEGSITTWNNIMGKKAYMVNSIDSESMEVEASYLGELDDIELMQTKEKIEQQRLKNHKWSRVGMKLFARFESIEDKAKTEYFQNLVRKGLELTSYDSEKLLKSVEEEIPALDDGDEEETELEKMMNMVNSGDLDAQVQIENNLGEDDD